MKNIKVYEPKWKVIELHSSSNSLTNFGFIQVSSGVSATFTSKEFIN